MADAVVKLSLDASSFTRGLALARAGVAGLSTGITSVAGFGIKALALTGAAAIGLGTALAIGTKKAFDFGGKLKDMSAITGRSVREILLMKRALQDAGISMEKIDRYILTGKDRGNVIGRALGNMTKADWADAAASVGHQADILAKNANTFDRVSDLLGRSGDKLQGFFVGVADRVSKVLLPLLEKFDKSDFSAIGQKFGDGLVYGAQALVGFFQNPALLFDTATNYFKAGMLGVGNVLLAVFKTSIEFFQASFVNMFNGIDAIITGALIHAFQSPIAYLKAGIEEATDTSRKSKSAINFQIGVKSKLRDTIGYNMSGQLNSIGKGYQSDIDKLKAQLPQSVSFGDRYKRIMGELGAESNQFTREGGQQLSAGMQQGLNAARNFSVPDVLGAGNAMRTANWQTSRAQFFGEPALNRLVSPDPFGYASMARAQSRGPASLIGGYAPQYGAYGRTESVRAKEEDRPASKQDLESVMEKYWGR